MTDEKYAALRERVIALLKAGQTVEEAEKTLVDEGTPADDARPLVLELGRLREDARATEARWAAEREEEARRRQRAYPVAPLPRLPPPPSYSGGSGSSGKVIGGGISVVLGVILLIVRVALRTSHSYGGYTPPRYDLGSLTSPRYVSDDFAAATQPASMCSAVLDGVRCRVKEVTPAVVLELEARADRDKITVVLHERATPKDLASLKKLPWLRSVEATRALDIAPFAELPELRELVLYEAGVRSLVPLAQARKLERLELSRCSGLGEASLSPLAKLPLKKLVISGKGSPSETAALAQLALLEEASFGDVPGQKLSPLAGARALRRLDVTNAGDYAFLPALTGLVKLEIHESKELDLSKVQRLRGLKWLAVESDKLTSLAPLAGLSLERLDVGATSVKDLSPLRAMKSLREAFVPAEASKASVDALRAANPALELTLE